MQGLEALLHVRPRAHFLGGTEKDADFCARSPRQTAVANGVIYLGSEDQNVYALNAATGATLKLWRSGFGEIHARVSVVEPCRSFPVTLTVVEDHAMQSALSKERDLLHRRLGAFSFDEPQPKRPRLRAIWANEPDKTTT